MEDAALPSVVLLQEADVQAIFMGYYYDRDNKGEVERSNKLDDSKKDNGNVISTADVHISSV